MSYLILASLAASAISTSSILAWERLFLSAMSFSNRNESGDNVNDVRTFGIKINLSM